MFSAATKTDNAIAVNYIEDVFSTWLYAGNSAFNRIENNIALASGATQTGGSVLVPGTFASLGPSSGNANYAFGTGDFTIEGFINLPTVPTGTSITNANGLITLADGSNGGWGVRVRSPFGNTNLQFSFSESTFEVISGTVTSFPLNTWRHIAVTRASNTVRIFVNGVLVSSGSTAKDFSLTSGPVVGYSADTLTNASGYFSNVRLNKGTALYTANFTPPTSPLTAVSGTVLLFCQNPNPLVDNSSIGAAIGQTSLPNVKSFGPFTGSSVTSAGGMVWIKGRSGATDHALYDTARGATFDLVSNSSAAQTTQTTGLTSFNTNGFSIGSLAKINTDAATYASWTFRKQAKFFDVVTYTGNGANRTIAHNLGSVPGCIIVKRTDATADWQVYHRSLANTEYLVLNTTAAKATGATRWNSTTPTSTTFSLGTSTDVNANTGTYVAYLFAHDAGGFGAAGTDNVISCGLSSGANNSVNLGYEPQWILIKRIDSTSEWFMYDSMRGLVADISQSNYLVANTINAEVGSGFVRITSTGFIQSLTGDYIYIAIRRGPMRTPTSGASVFSPIAVNAVAGTTQTTNFVVDLQIKANRSLDGINSSVDDRVRGVSTTTTASGRYLITSQIAIEATANATTRAWSNTGFQIPTYYASLSTIFWSFGRAPSFLDVVCYTGTGANTTVSHNLNAVPEFMIVKRRDTGAASWAVYSSVTGNTTYLTLNNNGGNNVSATFWNNTTPTSTNFTVGTSTNVNGLNQTYVAYLFASCPGVSKFGSYTGTGALQTINCGFAAGARFVMIKRTNATGDWYVYDSARGITSGNDPFILWNSNAGDDTTTNYVDTASTGFQVTAAAPAGLNANGGTYMFLAIA